MKTVAVILAAGLGTRMKSRIPKVLHPVLGDATLLWVLRSLPSDLSGALVVVHHGREQVMEALAGWKASGLLPCEVVAVDQGEPLGTGHAVQVCIPELDRLRADRVVILSGDVPLTRPGTVARLCAADGLLLAMDLEYPGAYGRVLQKGDGRLEAIVEFKDADEAQRAVKRVNGGAYTLPYGPLRDALGRLTNANAQREYYLTDAVVAVSRTHPVAVETVDPLELGGMNSRLDQAELQRIARERINAAWMAEGVTFLDPATALVGPRVSLGRDTVVEPGVRLEGDCEIGEGCRLGQGSVVLDSWLGEGVELRPYSILDRAKVGDGAKVGPFARLREGTDLAEGVHVGNFVETKKTRMHRGAKANHLTYLGDAEIGENTNVGAGVITCNYDGVHKHKTTIGKDVFVGSDSQLVAPVTIGDGAIIGAGTTVTKDVPAEALALSRTPQSNKDEAAPRLREKQRRGKRQQG